MCVYSCVFIVPRETNTWKYLKLRQWALKRELWSHWFHANLKHTDSSNLFNFFLTCTSTHCSIVTISHSDSVTMRVYICLYGVSVFTKYNRLFVHDARYLNFSELLSHLFIRVLFYFHIFEFWWDTIRDFSHEKNLFSLYAREKNNFILLKNSNTCLFCWLQNFEVMIVIYLIVIEVIKRPD